MSKRDDDGVIRDVEVVKSGIRSRIVGHEMIPVAELTANPANWRVHPKGQVAVVGDSLHTLGWLRGILFNRVTGNMIDGHLRVEIAEREGEQAVPADIVELTPEEEDVALALLDPSGAMATANQEKLNVLLDKAKAFFADQKENATARSASALLESLRANERAKKASRNGEGESVVAHDGKRAMTVDEKAAQYENTTLRQIMLPFDVEGFAEAMRLLELVRNAAQVETNTEAVLLCLQYYCTEQKLLEPDDSDVEV